MVVNENLRANLRAFSLAIAAKAIFFCGLPPGSSTVCVSFVGNEQYSWAGNPITRFIYATHSFD